MSNVFVPFSWKGGDYMVEIKIIPGSTGKRFGPHPLDPPLPDEPAEIEVVGMEVDGEPGMITEETYIAAQESDAVWMAAMAAGAPDEIG